MREGIELPLRQHIVPQDVVSKEDLLILIAHHFKRGDIRISPFETSSAVDRTLTTTSPDKNQELWRAAGYSDPPSVHRMVYGLAAHK
jgi:hypothetical protein